MSRTPSSAKPVTFGQPVSHGNEDFENSRVSRLSVSREPSYSHYNAVQFQREFNNRNNPNNPPFVVEYPISSEAANQVVKKPKMWDVNRYATKKTIAQGMLDIALLTTNASQLKFILQIGVEHDYYTLMLTLIGISIGLQLVQGIICVLLGSNFDINNEHHQGKANLWNDVCMSMMVVTVAVNVILSSFELRDSNYVQYRSMKPSISDEGNA
ncbi:ninjurin-2-like isoform X2 [Belonocnema kinseyi]|uniref:ninjurin-2-like isoform X2 n=1 Tax=Belonocnema kinseyi TaxID=2817044 RepID=UPI00143DBBBE|nr:ninjurin-2-like isoform X2 [Belonocnema kinseyi]